MNKNGYCYLTIERNSDGEELKHYGLKKMGFGRTNDISRRFREHHLRGSKASVGVEFVQTYDCDEFNLSDSFIETSTHKILENLGFIHITRDSLYESENEKFVSTTEIYSGKSKETIAGIVHKGEELSADLIKRIISNISNVDLFKRKLTLYPHQEKAYKFILDCFNKAFKEVLLNHKPRSGKSFIAYYYMIMQKPQYVLLLTQFPILNGQWKSEFENLRDHNYNIINVRELNVEKVSLDKTRPNLVMISLQDAKGEDLNDVDNQFVEGLKKDKFEQLRKIDWDLVIFDEIHKGKETPKTDRLLNQIKYKKLIGLSATPTKNLLRGTFTLENTDRYTLAEENEYRKLYPEFYKNPFINHYLFNIDDNTRKEMKYFNEEEYFNFVKFFSLEKNNLVYYNDIVTLFRWFFCLGRYKNGATHRIVNKCQSILFFVQSNECQEKVAEILKELVGEVYDVYFTNSEVNSSSQLLEKIKNEYIPTNGKKVIVIANKQLTTGITLRYCDMVVFMNNWKSIDDYIQASYRCQSPMDGKTECYTVDLNPSRAYNIFHQYIESNSSFKKYDINEAIKEYLNCAPIFESFGKDLKKIDFEEFKKRVVESIKIGSEFFPFSIINKDEIESEKDNLLRLGELSSEKVGSEKVKLDKTQPDDGKNIKPKGKKEKEMSIRQTDDYKELLNKILTENAEYLLERVPLLSITTEFKCDNIDSIFDELDNDDEKRKLFLKDLLIDKK